MMAKQASMIPPQFKNMLKNMLDDQVLGLPGWAWMLGYCLILSLFATYLAFDAPTLPRQAHMHLPQ